MKIYINGCSHTRGTNLSLPQTTDAYPYLLKNALNANIINKATVGGSNEKIVRQTIEDLCLDKNVDLVILQWTDNTRFESPVKLRDPYHRQYSTDGWLQHRPTTALWPERKKLDIAWRQYYKQNYAIGDKAIDTTLGLRIKLFKKHLTQILALNAFIQSLGIRVINMCFLPFVFKVSMSKDIQNLEWIIDPYIGMDVALLNSGCAKCRKRQAADMAGTYDGHYEKDGHLLLSQWILNYLKDGTTINKNSFNVDKLKESSTGGGGEFDFLYEWGEE